MATSSTEPVVGKPPGRGRLLLALGFVLALAGIGGYIVQVAMLRLTTPWYMPALTTLGALLLVVSLWQRRTFWRILGLVVLVLLAGAEWAILFMAMLPKYEGPVTESKPFPKFATEKADGTSFTQSDLESGQNSLLVFFRGRW